MELMIGVAVGAFVVGWLFVEKPETMKKMSEWVKSKFTSGSDA